MKILETCFTLGSGGAERFVVDLSNELGKIHDVTLLTLKDDQKQSNQRAFYRDEVESYVRYENLRLRDGIRISSLWRVYKYIKSEKPNIVHLNGHAAPYFFIIAILMLAHKTCFVQTIHSDINNYKDLLYRFLCSFWGHKHDYHFVAISENNRKDFVRYYPHAYNHLIFNGRSKLTRTSEYSHVQEDVNALRKSPNTMVFLHIARCHEAKNQELLIHAINQLTAEGKDVQLLIIGDGFETPLGLSLKKKACPCIHFLGPKRNVADYLFSADVFCLSSVYEGLPITIIEAQLCGLPIVSTPVCGATDLVCNEINGILSDDFTLQSYCAALCKVIENYQILKKGAQNAQNDNPYTMVNCAKQYAQLYSDIVKKTHVSMGVCRMPFLQ